MNPNDGRVVSNFIVQALKGEDITIYGTGRQTRSFLVFQICIRNRGAYRIRIRILMPHDPHFL